MDSAALLLMDHVPPHLRDNLQKSRVLLQPIIASNRTLTHSSDSTTNDAELIFHSRPTKECRLGVGFSPLKYLEFLLLILLMLIKVLNTPSVVFSLANEFGTGPTPR